MGNGGCETVVNFGIKIDAVLKEDLEINCVGWIVLG